MKKTISILLILCLCVTTFACSSPEQADYSRAMQLLKMNDASSERTFDEFGLEASVSSNDRKQAYEILKNLGDYKDCVQLCEKLENWQAESEKYAKYNTAVEQFEAGNFDSAKPVFEEFAKENYLDSKKYIAGINAFAPFIGEWSYKHGTYAFDCLNVHEINCTIGAPFSIGSSHFSDCDWVVTASISINVKKTGAAEYWGRDAGTGFILNTNEGFHHSASEKDAYKLDNSVFCISNSNPYQFIFAPSRGVYADIYLSLLENESLRLVEIPIDINHSTAYYDEAGDITLSR